MLKTASGPAKTPDPEIEAWVVATRVISLRLGAARAWLVGDLLVGVDFRASLPLAAAAAGPSVGAAATFWAGERGGLGFAWEGPAAGAIAPGPGVLRLELSGGRGAWAGAAGAYCPLRLDVSATTAAAAAVALFELALFKGVGAGGRRGRGAR